MPQPPTASTAAQRTERLGLLLVNLGTPQAPRPAEVRRFLAQFLWDRRVVEAPRWLWWLALNGVILRFRPSRSAHAYQQIWTPEGSPLMVYSQALAAQVEQVLADATPPPLEPGVALGMTYGSPSIPDALQQLRRVGLRRLIVLPLYPQYSATTAASVFDQVTTELQRWRQVPSLDFISDYHDHPGYIQAIADSIQAHWREHERNHLVMSFHGIPQRYVLAGDPYYDQCLQSAQLIARRLRLAEDDFTVCFQSQVGREPWLKPYTEDILKTYAGGPQRRVTVVCPGFATDCLETLEEIAIRNREDFLAAGGESFSYVPSLNASTQHAQVLVDVIARHLPAQPQVTAAAVASGA